MRSYSFTMIKWSLFLIVALQIHPIATAHFRGGAISWRPATNAISVINSSRTIIITQRYTWSKSALASMCTASTITSGGLIGENAVSSIGCVSPSWKCTESDYVTSISTFVPCTDFNNVLGMSYGHSETAVNLTVQSYGIVLQYWVGGAWLTLQMSAGGWSLVASINLEPRPDNQQINSSPESNIPSVVYIPSGLSTFTAVNIPMTDPDGDLVECRFALASNVVENVTVDECNNVCEPVALPASTQLNSSDGNCTLMVKLPTVGYYAVAIQLEDFLENSTTPLSSVPVQFLLLAYDATNPTSSCTIVPIITSIPPDLPAPGSTITVQDTVLYTAMVIAQTGCDNDTATGITNFITSSPSGMLKTALPFAWTSPSYAINLTWTPTLAQLGQTFSFCAIAVDSNYYTSNQYCFNILVVPKTTTTTTTSTTTSTSPTSTTSTSTTTTSTTSVTTTPEPTKPTDCLPFIFGLSLGLGIPLLLLLSLLSLCHLCRWCPGPLRLLLQQRFGHEHRVRCPHCQKSFDFDSKKNQSSLTAPGGTRRYREQYISSARHDKSFDRRTISQYGKREFPSTSEFFLSRALSPHDIRSSTAASFVSPFADGFLFERLSNATTPVESTQSFPTHHGSILMRAYSRQVQPL